jgi:hypothetical protein
LIKVKKPRPLGPGFLLFFPSISIIADRAELFVMWMWLVDKGLDGDGA